MVARKERNEKDMKEYLEGFNFYQVIIRGFDVTALTIGTYRPEQAVKSLFKGVEEFEGADVDVWEISLKELQGSKEWFPIFCVELHTEYSDLEELVKDLMVWRIAGMMDKEMEGMA